MRPLVWLPGKVGSQLIAPIPTYLFKRFTDGIYYEIFEDPDFSQAFGKSFQKYVGDALRIATLKTDIEVASEREYFVGRDRKDSVDWIVSDRMAALFVECKTKRLRYAAKIALDMTDALDDDLEKMAGFIVQTYRAQADCMLGYYSHWTQGHRDIFPVVVTLEDWYAFGDRIIAQELDKRVLAGA